MRIHHLLFVFILLLGIGISACTNSEEPNENDYITLEGIIRIQDTFEIKEGKRLLVKPGTEITFAPGAIFVAHGNMYIEGTEEEPIKLIAEDPIEDHRIITAKSGCKVFRLKHTEVIDGLITSYGTDNHFQHVTFRNSQKLKWNNAVARFWFGSVLIEDCIVDWNDEGEGFLLHNVPSPIVQNCSFSRIPDAVEYLHCSNGQIIGNYFEKMGDDAIDQNHCFKTLIKDNIFYKVRDKALELGSESFGSSDSLYVINNLFIDCKVALNVKESSFAIVENATFYKNKISIDIHTHEDSSRISSTIIKRSVVVNSDLPASVNPRSIAVLNDCMSDEPLPDGINNIVSQIMFRDPDNNDFTIIEGDLPEGETAETMGYQAPK